MEFPSGPVAKTWHFHCGGLGSIPGWGTKILQAVWHSQKVIIVKKIKLKEKKRK